MDAELWVGDTQIDRSGKPLNRHVIRTPETVASGMYDEVRGTAAGRQGTGFESDGPKLPWWESAWNSVAGAVQDVVDTAGEHWFGDARWQNIKGTTKAIWDNPYFQAALFVGSFFIPGGAVGRAVGFIGRAFRNVFGGLGRGLGAAGRALAGAGRAIGGSKASLLQGAAGFVDDALVGRASPQLVGPPKPVANGVLHRSDFFPNYLPNARNENLSRTIRNILSNPKGGHWYRNRSTPKIPGGMGPFTSYDHILGDFAQQYPGKRGPGRIVVGSDNSWWYTPDHYKTWVRLL